MPFDIDRYAHLSSVIHEWDPRLKMISLGLFAVITAVAHSIPVAVLALFIILSILGISHLPFSFVMKNLKWVVMFLLPFFILLPISYPGPKLHVLGIPFTMEGLRLSILIFLKAVTIVITTHIIFGTTRFDTSVIALQRMKCPGVIVQMILFTYRYIFVFLDELRRMQKAMKSKGFVMKTNMHTLKTVGNFIGTLLIRSYERTRRVYDAMQSKGYCGTFHSLREFKAKRNDYIKALLMGAITILLLIIEIMNIFPPAAKGWY